MKRIAIILAIAAIAACGGKKDEPKDKDKGSAAAMTAPATGSAAPAGSAAGSAVAAKAGSNVDVPTEQDFEGQAKTDITTANVDTKVKAIEDQLGQQ